ncbi:MULTISPECIES: SLATT domain-containing protein [unclassified Sphingobacterium]|uniref:SLATT domain-containing protein n=1 Tax=unclassified Sphingobacterium TaxID=2609468 RepID=UPI0025D5D16B|nr:MULTISPECIES: SLATT domain-containing protein [unclassified Sphingobacterium]
MTEKSIFTGEKAYLEKSFLEELSLKVWTTKGARFQADQRLRAKARMSNISMSIFSAYLIIASLISVYVDNHTNNNFQLINYFVTALSIILLVLSQYENAQDYKLRAEKLHQCGLDISEIYNEVRIFKTLTGSTDEEIRVFCKNISYRYQAILSKYENHMSIDYSMFKTTQSHYFDNLKPKDSKKIKRKLWWIVNGWYTMLIIGTPLVFIALSLMRF